MAEVYISFFSLILVIALSLLLLLYFIIRPKPVHIQLRIATCSSRVALAASASPSATSVLVAALTSPSLPAASASSRRQSSRSSSPWGVMSESSTLTSGTTTLSSARLMKPVRSTCSCATMGFTCRRSWRITIWRRSSSCHQQHLLVPYDQKSSINDDNFLLS
ncbi:3-dehydrosphinganine reductase tsc10b [Phtheirospermum japonicum]|uniref:3-dehydrosphinganine reductase tsc10b n=1 Tax=Phtheirospermum japonicum TaxID=374723 RepID=A0A830BA95_9LAMI|nr:3-dehydrosphinganine reductase tsc10b [Phtheirospermum japonicum]